jgi:hypothetical protein
LQQWGGKAGYASIGVSSVMLAAVRDLLVRFLRTGFPDFGYTGVLAIRKDAEVTIGLNELYEIESATVEFAG